MVTLEALKNIRFVVDISGKQAAVQVSIDDWRKILDYFEELEDRERVKEILRRLEVSPEGSQAVDWQKVRGQW